jgi:hypothetical protein
MQPAPETGHRLALLVATSAYSDPDLRQLRAPGHDADQLAEVLRDPRIGGFDVQVLINAASGEVQEGIEDFCTDRHPDDQLLIYLSCHGVLDSYGRLYYAAANTRRQRLAATAVGAAWLNERLEDCRARRQILVLDCCHSGAFAKGAKGDSGLALQQRFEPHGRGRVVLTASRSTEYSFEGGQASGEGLRSVFTHAIVNGLRTGDADRDKDGLITVTDLYQYVYDSVRAAEPRQTPELWTYGAEGNLLVAHSIRGAVIEPESLPEDLRMTLESPRRRVRETGVAELADLLDGPNPGLALTARQALERIAEEDQPQVSALARIAVGAPVGEAADQVRRELTERAHREEQARQEAARREAEEQARREVEQLQRQIREHAAAQDWDAVLAVNNELAALDPAAADPDGLASAAREQITSGQQAERESRTESGQASPTLLRADQDTGTLESATPEPSVVGPGITNQGSARMPGDGDGRPVPRLTRRRALFTLAGTGALAGIAVTAWELAQGSDGQAHATGSSSSRSHTVTSRTPSSSPTTRPTAALKAPGTKLWSFHAPGPVVSGPVAAGNVVYAADDNPNGGPNSHNVYAFDAATGDVIWTAANYAEFYTWLAVSNNLLYFGSDFHSVTALYCKNGHMAWQYATGDIVSSAPIVSGKAVYVGSDDQYIYALNAANGDKIWRYKTAGPVQSAPTATDRAVYVGSSDGKIYAIDATTGRLMWLFPTAAPVTSQLATAGGVVFAGGNGCIFSTGMNIS